MALRKKFIKVTTHPIKEEVFVLGDPQNIEYTQLKLDLTKKLKGKPSEAVLFIKKEGNELHAYPKRIEVLKSYIIRLIRKKTSYVEDSFEGVCKDSAVYRIKPFLVTRRKVPRSIRKALRDKTKEIILQKLKELTFLQSCEAILSESLQKELLHQLKKIYPLSACEIRVFETKDYKKIETKTKDIETKEVEEDNEVTE
ncbi:MAG: hypothetical protein QW273_01920 [Candidatus Pacearchaeota archaeon]